MCLTQTKNNGMINPLLNEADFYFLRNKIETKKKLKKLLTEINECDIISELLMRTVEKELEKINKKVLDNIKIS